MLELVELLEELMLELLLLTLATDDAAGLPPPPQAESEAIQTSVIALINKWGFFLDI